MRTSEKGIELIKKFEGCHLHAYLCPANVWTIGYGHTNGVTQGLVITQKQADDFLLNDLRKFEEIVNAENARHKYNFSQNEFDALVSFAFNCGQLNLKKLLRDGLRNKKEIATAFTLYINANGKPLKGLINRRLAEKHLFEYGDLQTASVPLIASGYLPLKLNNLMFHVKHNYNIRSDGNRDSMIIGNTNSLDSVAITGVKGDFFATPQGYISKDAFYITLKKQR